MPVPSGAVPGSLPSDLRLVMTALLLAVAVPPALPSARISIIGRDSWASRARRTYFLLTLTLLDVSRGCKLLPILPLPPTDIWEGAMPPMADPVSLSLSLFHEAGKWQRV